MMLAVHKAIYPPNLFSFVMPLSAVYGSSSVCVCLQAGYRRRPHQDPNTAQPSPGSPGSPGSGIQTPPQMTMAEVEGGMSGGLQGNDTWQWERQRAGTGWEKSKRPNNHSDGSLGTVM